MITENTKRKNGSIESLWVSASIVIYAFCALPPIVIGAQILALLPPAPAAVALSFLVLTGFFFFLFLLILVCGFLHLLMPLPQEGEFPLLREGQVRRWMAHTSVVNLLRVPGFIRWIFAIRFLRSLYFRLSGARIHPSATISYEALLPDPFLLEIGEGAEIGNWVKISAHFVDRDKFLIKRIHIGKNAIIGANSVILAGAVIGDNAVIPPGSLILPGTVVPDGEAWSGR